MDLVVRLGKLKVIFITCEPANYVLDKSTKHLVKNIVNKSKTVNNSPNPHNIPFIIILNRERYKILTVEKLQTANVRLLA